MGGCGRELAPANRRFGRPVRGPRPDRQLRLHDRRGCQPGQCRGGLGGHAGRDGSAPAAVRRVRGSGSAAAMEMAHGILLEGSQGGSTRKPQSAVIVGIGELLVKDAFPAGVIDAGLTRPAPTRHLATVDSGQPRRALGWRVRFGHRLLCSLAGRPCLFIRSRSAKHFQAGLSVGDYFAMCHLIFIVREVAETLQHRSTASFAAASHGADLAAREFIPNAAI